MSRGGRPAVARGAYSPAERARLFGGAVSGPAFEGREVAAVPSKLRWADGAGSGVIRAGDVPAAPVVPGERGELIDYECVETRLVEAFRTLHALPDPAPGPRLRMMALWREVAPERVDIDAEPSPGRPGVSRFEMGRMDEALAWCEWLKPEARRLVGVVIAWQASDRGEVRWTEIRQRLRVETTTEALRKAYSRALSRICGKLNASR
jgi:hypothetical protein